MKKSLLFIILFMLFIIPIEVKAGELYVDHGEYQYSETYIEEKKDLEVKKVVEEGKTLYRYRTRDYIIVPEDLVIRSRDFNVINYIDTNLSLEDIEITEYYDLKTMNKCNGSIEIKYKKATMGFVIYINIENYIDIPEVIEVNDHNFDIWNYIETDIENKEDIQFIGEYDLTKNAEYELLITYNDISKNVKIIVNIDENKMFEEDIKEENKNDNNKEEIEENINNDNSEDLGVVNDVNNNIYNEEKVVERIYDPICTNNYYEIKDSTKEVEYVDKIVPVTNKVNFKNTDYNKTFRYISYAFYCINTILLSIFVIRKK